MSTESTADERILNLESVVAHLQHDLDQLNTVILQQQSEIDGLNETLTRLQSRLEQADARPEERSVEDERPPHY